MRPYAFPFISILLISSCSMPSEISGERQPVNELRELLGLSSGALPADRWEISLGPESLFANLPLESAHMFEVELPFGLSSFPVKLTPFDNDSGCVVYYHAGHGGLLDGISYAVENQTYSPILFEILRLGCEVVLFGMPHGGRGSSSKNSNPHFAFMPDGTALDLRDWPAHGAFESFPEAHQAGALGVFILPVHSMTQYFLGREIPPAIGMFGLSGGGWATVLAAATIDEISFAVAVAGSDPEESLAYDYEQSHPIIEEYGYENLYADAVRSGTDFVHVYNSLDPCCFRAEGKDLYGLELRMSDLASNYPEGDYQIFVDESGDGHSIRPETESLILGKVETLREQ